jgi:hypothetical protein
MDEHWWMECAGRIEPDGSRTNIGQKSNKLRTKVEWMLDGQMSNRHRTNIHQINVRWKSNGQKLDRRRMQVERMSNATATTLQNIHELYNNVNDDTTQRPQHCETTMNSAAMVNTMR